MTDFSCLLAGLLNLLGPILLMIFWCSKSGARMLPALIAFGVCLPVFVIGAAVRSMFHDTDAVAFYLKQGLLYGIIEETAKFLMLRFALPTYDSPKDAVTYGIGHSAYETFASGVTCLGLIGTGQADPNILWIQIFSFIEGTAFCAAATVLIFYGIRTDKTKLILPIVILLHMLSSAGAGLLADPAVVVLRTLLTGGMCCAAYRCRQAIADLPEDAV